MRTVSGDTEDDTGQPVAHMAYKIDLDRVLNLSTSCVFRTC